MPESNAPDTKPPARPGGWLSSLWVPAVVCGSLAIAAFAVAALLINIRERKDEGRHTYWRLVEVDEDTTDPERWGINFPSQLNGYKRTAEATRTKFGGHGGSEALPQEKADRDPWLKRLYAGYAFSIDYRDRRGHAYMLGDQEQTKRVTGWKKPQPGACLHCHASVMPLYRFAGKGDVMAGFEKVCGMSYKDAHDMKDDQDRPLIRHPVSCVDCHDPKTQGVRVTRPGFIAGIKALKAKEGKRDYDPNRDATRQEMRSFVCGQCHVEYYFKGPGKVVTYPWHGGLKVEEMEAYYETAEDGKPFTDWTHEETGAKALKMQHPEFEMWSQGIHARSGVACADCHMPYLREGAMKVSDHWVRSPLLNVNRACQTCHHYPETELLARAETIQGKTHALLQRAAAAYTDMLDAIVKAKKAGASEEKLGSTLALQRRAQMRLDFVSSENSMGFHAPQEAARLLGEAIDFARQGQVEALKLAAVP